MNRSKRKALIPKSIPRHISLKKDVLMIGCGGLGKAMLELNTMCGYLPFRDIDIIEPLSLGSYDFYKSYSITHYKEYLTPDNIESILHTLIPGKTIVLDVSIGVNALDIVKMCTLYGVMYVNTSLENWEVKSPEKLETSSKKLYPRTLHYQYSKLMNMKKDVRPTTVFDHGMNPGLISHLAKKGIKLFYKHFKGVDIPINSRKDLRRSARELKIKAIHISELDTQKLSKKIKYDPNTFYNTWSGMGMIAEAIDPIQVGHFQNTRVLKDAYNSRSVRSARDARNSRDIDDVIKEKGYTPSQGGKNIRYYPVRGMDRQTHTLVITPSNKIKKTKGYLIPHGEANTLSRYLSSGEYTPNVYYVYHPSSITIKSLNVLRKRKYHHQKRVHHVLDQFSLEKNGYDSIGAYIINEHPNINYNWWTGTVLSLKDVRNKNIKYAGPTEIQVAISYLSCVKWMLRNPKMGICSPEDIPSDLIVRWCKGYLGKFVNRKIVKTPEIF